MSIELDVKLIKYVEKFPYLFYKGAINHNNELLLANTWNKIGRDLKVSPDYCMNRWKYLRRRFTREPRFTLPEKEWVLMKYLRFLEPFIHRRKPVDILTEIPSVPEFELNGYPSICSRVSESATLVPSWKQSNESFCCSLTNTLQRLTPEQQVSCRIDILVVIEKYLSSISGGDGSNSTLSTPSILHSRLDTLASDVSKRFAEILAKINNGSVSSFDEDWFIILSVKNFFCKLLEMRKVNAELDEMLPIFMSTDTVPQTVNEYENKQADSDPQTAVEINIPVRMNLESEMSNVSSYNEGQSSSNSNSQLVDDTAEIRICAVKTESVDNTPLDSFEYDSQGMRDMLKSNEDFVTPNRSWQLPESMKTIDQMPVYNNPVQHSSSLITKQASPIFIETNHPIKMNDSGTLSHSFKPVSENLPFVSSIKLSSKNISLKPSLTKEIPKPTHTTNKVIRIRPSTSVNIETVSKSTKSTVSLKTSKSTVNLRPSNSITHSNNSNFPGSRFILEEGNEEFENTVHETLKKINSEDCAHGFMLHGDRFLCVLCDVWLPTELYKNAHTRDAKHINYTRNYFLHCSRVKKTALPKLDHSLYVARQDGLYCVKCKVVMRCRSNFVSHMTCERHKNHVRTLSRYVDIEATMICSTDQGIVQIGTYNYCVLCNVKLFGSFPVDHISSARHQKEISLSKGIFKIDRHAYCSFCNEKFPPTALTLHVDGKKHAQKIANNY